MRYIVAQHLHADTSEPMPRKTPPTPSRIGMGEFEFRKIAEYLAQPVRRRATAPLART